jgi:hypothetical protein
MPMRGSGLDQSLQGPYRLPFNAASSLAPVRASGLRLDSPRRLSNGGARLVCVSESHRSPLVCVRKSVEQLSVVTFPSAMVLRS